MAMLSHYLRVPRNFEICRIGQVRGTALLLWPFKYFSYQPEICWDDARYDEADCYLNCHARPFFARSAELSNSQNRLGPYPREDITVLAL